MSRRGAWIGSLGPGTLAAGCIATALVIATALAGAGCFAATETPTPPAAGSAPITGIVRGRVRAPGGATFDVEVVQDPESRARGLQERARLPEGEGMVFAFSASGRHRFWMYKCRIPLDIVWLDAQGSVVAIENSLPVCAELPCKEYEPQADARFVLELGAGVAARRGIRKGTKLELVFSEPLNPR